VNEIEKSNQQIINRYNTRRKIYIIAIIVVLFIVVFIQKEVAVKILTIATLIGIHFIIKSTTGLERAKVKCIKAKDYKVLETEIVGFEKINQEVDEYKPSRTITYLNFKDTGLLYEIEPVERKYAVGDKVILQTINYKNNEHIINIIKK